MLKIDGTFVAGLGHEPQDASIAAAVISLAHALGLRTVAEGIETDEQLDDPAPSSAATSARATSSRAPRRAAEAVRLLARQ